MYEYPEVLLPRQSYPPLLSADKVLQYTFVRETQEDIYTFLEQGCNAADILQKVINPQPSMREVFELSIFLYGYYDENHAGLKVSDKSLYNPWTCDLPDISVDRIDYFREREVVYSLFLYTEKLYNKPIIFNEKPFLLSFSHKPTQANYWHFQLCTTDSTTGEGIPRNRDKNHLKHLAKHILEQYVMKAICPKSEVKRFQFQASV